jgi:hypothetical protein
VLNFGSLNIDHVYQVDHVVRPGETLPSANYQVFAGGKGANQSAPWRWPGCGIPRRPVGLEGGWLVANRPRWVWTCVSPRPATPHRAP